MFVLLKSKDKYRGIFTCDICKKPIGIIEEGKVIISAQDNRYLPRSHVHEKCFIDDSESKDQYVVISLKDFIKAMVEDY